MNSANVLIAFELLQDELFNSLGSDKEMPIGSLFDCMEEVNKIKIRYESEHGFKLSKQNALNNADLQIENHKRTTDADFYLPILVTLKDLGGRAETSQVLDLVFQKMVSRLTSYDMKAVDSSNEPRWRNTARFAVKDLKDKGLLEKNSLRGIWLMTQKGYDAINSYMSDGREQ